MRAAADSPSPPRVPPHLDRAGPLGAVGPVSLEGIEVSGVDFSEQRAAGLSFDAVRLARVDVSGSRLDELRLIDAELTDCNLANLQGRGVSASRVAIDRSRLTGISVPGATLRDLAIRGCRIDLAAFGTGCLTRVTFEDCVLCETSFLEAELDSVRFHRCDLTRADFRGARLHRCEFRGSDLTGLEGTRQLSGAAIDWPTVVELAGVWAAALGIDVLDAD